MVIKIRYPNTVKLDELLMSLRILDITVLGFLIQWNHVTYIWVPFFVQFSVPFLAPSCVPFCALFRVPYFIQFQFSVPFRALFCLPCSALLSHLRPVLCFLLGSVLSVRLHSVVCSLLGSVMFHFAFPICVPFCVTSFWVPFSFYLLHSVFCSFLCSFWSPPIFGICLYWPNAYSDQVSTKSAKQKCGN